MYHDLSAPPSISTVGYNFQQSVLEVNCTSTGSVASNVIWMKDGEIMDIDGARILSVQKVTDRIASTYNNILTFYDEPVVTAGNYCCNVSNSLGSSSQCVNVTGKTLSFANHGFIYKTC